MIGIRALSPNAELSRSAQSEHSDEAGEQRISHKHRKQKARRLSAQVSRLGHAPGKQISYFGADTSLSCEATACQ